MDKNYVVEEQDGTLLAPMTREVKVKPSRKQIKLLKTKEHLRRINNGRNKVAKAVGAVLGASAATGPLVGFGISALPTLAPGTAVGNFIGQMANATLGGMAVDEATKGLNKIFGNKPMGWGETMSSTVPQSIKDASPELLKLIGQVVADMTNPGYFSNPLKFIAPKKLTKRHNLQLNKSKKEYTIDDFYKDVEKNPYFDNISDVHVINDEHYNILGNINASPKDFAFSEDMLNRLQKFTNIDQPISVFYPPEGRIVMSPREYVKRATLKPIHVYAGSPTSHVSGFHRISRGTSYLAHNSPHPRATAIHEKLMHGTDFLIKDAAPKVVDEYKNIISLLNKNTSSFNGIKSALDWEELRATLGEMRFVLLKNSKNTTDFENIVDNISFNGLLNMLNSVNGYGQIYATKALMSNKKEDILKAFKNALKYLPMTTLLIDTKNGN